MGVIIPQVVTESRASGAQVVEGSTRFDSANEDYLTRTPAVTSDRKKRNKGALEIKEHPALGVYVKGLQEVVVDSASKLQNIIDKGMSSRTVAATAMNADSSRSHSVFVIKVHVFTNYTNCL